MKTSILRKASAFLMLFLLLAMSMTSAFAAPDLTGRDPTLPVTLTIHHRTMLEGTVVPGNPAGPGQPNPVGAPIVGAQWQIQRVNLPADFNGNDPEAVAAIPPAWHEGTALTATTNGAGEAFFSGMPQGIYLVRELPSAVTSASEVHRPFLVDLPLQIDGTWIYDVHVYPKQETDVPPFSKVVHALDAYTIRWAFHIEITSALHALAPITGGADEIIRITDMIDPELTFVWGSVYLSFEQTGGNFINLPQGPGNWAYHFDENGMLSIEIFSAGRDAIYTGGLVGGTMRIVFDTDVTSFPMVTSLTEVSNTGTLYYGPAPSHTFGEGPGEVIPTANIFSLEINKVNTQNTPLAGAVFHLFRPSDLETIDGALRPIAGRNPIATLTSNEDGFASLGGITEGTYLLVEYQPPAGYNRFTAPMVLQINSTVTASDHIAAVTITNSSDFELPLTGGTGTLIFTILGIALIGGAVLLLVLLGKRMRDQQKDHHS